MEKNIKMSLETARQMYKEGNETTNKWLLENFTKEELEPKRGFAWEDSFSQCGYYIKRHVLGNVSPEPSRVNCSILGCNKDVFLTEKHAKSALAFAQLSHIVNKYNYGKELRETYFTVDLNSEKKILEVDFFNVAPRHFKFATKEDAKTSMEVNRQLWLDYWMID